MITEKRNRAFASPYEKPSESLDRGGVANRSKIVATPTPRLPGGRPEWDARSTMSSIGLQGTCSTIG